MRTNKRGFTLIEILFVVVVIAILAAIVIPRLIYTAETARINACQANVANINTQVELYRFSTGAWPETDFTSMLPAVSYDYFPDGLPTCPVDGSAYSMDATTHRVTGHSH